MKDRVESILQTRNIDATTRAVKVRRLHKDFLARFLGVVNNRLHIS